MPKFALVLVMAALAAAVQGFPTKENDIASAAAAGNWDEVHRLLGESLRQKYNLTPLSGDVRSLKPLQGGTVYGESEYAFKSSSNINGKTSEQSGGHKVINDNGRITEFDFKP